MITIIRQNPLHNKHTFIFKFISFITCVCVHMRVCADVCWEYNSVWAHKTAAFHSWVLRQQYFSRMNISSLPNDLRAVKDIAANSNCKRYIGFRRGMAFGRLCFKTMLGKRKIEGCCSHSKIITLGAMVQSWRCRGKLKVSFSVYQIYSRCCRKMQLQEGLSRAPGQGYNCAMFPVTFLSLQFSKP